MPNTPHALSEEFPDKIAAIGELKRRDAHFARLAEDYRRINRAVHRAETLVAPMEEPAEVELRKRRAALKDEIWGILLKY